MPFLMATSSMLADGDYEYVAHGRVDTKTSKVQEESFTRETKDQCLALPISRQWGET